MSDYESTDVEAAIEAWIAPSLAQWTRNTIEERMEAVVAAVAPTIAARARRALLVKYEEAVLSGELAQLQHITEGPSIGRLKAVSVLEGLATTEVLPCSLMGCESAALVHHHHRVYGHLSTRGCERDHDVDV